MSGRPGGGAAGRAGLFEDDLGDFQPTPPGRPEQVRGIAEQSGFRSREPAPPTVEKRDVRRYRTGRNQQLNLKVRAEDAAAFYAMADAQGWVLGETFAHAIAALQRELSKS
jgi:hypothetical protein